MIIKTYPIGIYDENIYVLVDEKSNDAFIVDPGGNGDLLIKNIEALGCNIKYILLTHGHFDHVEALNEVVEKFKAPIYINENEVNFMKTDKTVFGNPPKEYNLIKDGDVLPFGDDFIKCIHTPGHTKGGMCYLYKDVIFTGDTLFKGSVGRSDFVGGDFNELINSIKTKLMILDNDIKIYPGHMESSNIGYERMRNPFLQDEFDIF
ncbi:MBL fold metallo-hydrolase [Clostridium sp.]|uniref:MBL fold metallo-hydrolase n=1 Tax=Clostridium sp. TaxID=1506 RepID=UPI0025C0465D|nr:MBL fold metallo-hydrolase [Clostridium sp.]MCI9303997.1 MBL fold metallo-hydrolase [Clostridium sp.]